jgi:hypothetical protein
MEKKQEDSEEYILLSKKNIDNYIFRNEYKMAFGLLLLVLKQLDTNEKIEFINYYNENLKYIFMS